MPHPEENQVQEAAKTGDINTLKSILADDEKCKNLIETRNDISLTLLVSAGHYGHLECVEYLLGRGANIKAKGDIYINGDYKQGLVYLAAWNGCHEVIDFLARNYRTEFNTQLYALNESGNQTALHALGVHTQNIQEGRHQNSEFQARLEATARLLIDLGADRSMLNSERLTAAGRAAGHGNEQLAGVILSHLPCEALLQERAAAEQQRVDELLTQGRIAYNEPRYADAATIFGQFVALRPDKLDIRHALADALHNAGRYQEAEAEYTYCIERQPENQRAGLLFNRAHSRYAQSNFSNAFKDFCEGNRLSRNTAYDGAWQESHKLAVELKQLEGSIGMSPLLYAGHHGNLEDVKYLLECGADIHARNTQNQGLVYLTAWNGYYEVIDFLARNYPVELNVQLNVTNEDGNTPLHAVGVHTQNVQNGRHQDPEFQARLEATAKLLIDLGADKTIRNSEGLTAAERAERNGNQKLVGVILTDLLEGEIDQNNIATLEQILEEAKQAFYNSHVISRANYVKSLLQQYDSFFKALPEGAHRDVSICSIPGLQYQQVPGDGHCFYHAVSAYLGINDEDNVHTMRIRNQVADYIETHRNNVEFMRSVDAAIVAANENSDANITVDEYIAGVRSKQWADNLEIAVLMKVLGRPIVVLNPNRTIRNLPDLTGEGDPIFVQYNGDDHYDALISTGEKDPREILEVLTELNEHPRTAKLTIFKALIQVLQDGNPNDNSIRTRLHKQGNDVASLITYLLQLSVEVQTLIAEKFLDALMNAKTLSPGFVQDIFDTANYQMTQATSNWFGITTPALITANFPSDDAFTAYIENPEVNYPSDIKFIYFEVSYRYNDSSIQAYVLNPDNSKRTIHSERIANTTPNKEISISGFSNLRVKFNQIRSDWDRSQYRSQYRKTFEFSGNTGTYALNIRGNCDISLNRLHAPYVFVNVAKERTFVTLNDLTVGLDTADGIIDVKSYYCVVKGAVVVSKNILLDVSFITQEKASDIKAGENLFITSKLAATIDGHLTANVRIGVRVEGAFNYDIRNLQAEFVELQVSKVAQMQFPTTVSTASGFELIGKQITSPIQYELIGDDPSPINVTSEVFFPELRIKAQNNHFMLGTQSTKATVTGKKILIDTRSADIHYGGVFGIDACFILSRTETKLGHIDFSKQIAFNASNEYLPALPSYAGSNKLLLINPQNKLILHQAELVVPDGEAWLRAEELDNISSTIHVAKNAYIDIKQANISLCCEDLLQTGGCIKREDFPKWNNGVHENYKITTKALQVKTPPPICMVYGTLYISPRSEISVHGGALYAAIIQGPVPKNYHLTHCFERANYQLYGNKKRNGHNCQWWANGTKEISFETPYLARIVSDADINIQTRDEFTRITGHMISRNAINASVSHYSLDAASSDKRVIIKEFQPIVNIYINERPTFLYAKSKDASKTYMVPTVPITKFNLPEVTPMVWLPEGFVAANMQNLRKRYPEEHELQIILPKIIELLGHINLSGTGITPAEIWFKLYQNTQNWLQTNSQFKASVTQQDMESAVEPMLFYVPTIVTNPEGTTETVLDLTIYMPRHLYKHMLSANAGAWFADVIRIEGKSLEIFGAIQAQGRIEIALTNQLAQMPGSVIMGSDLELKVEVYYNQGGEVIATSGDIILECKKSLIESVAQRLGAGNCFEDKIIRAVFKANKILRISTIEDAVFKGVQLESGVMTEILSLARIIDLPVEQVWQRVVEYKTKRRTTIVTDQAILHQVSNFNSSGEVKLIALDEIMLIASSFEGNKISVSSASAVTIATVQNVQMHNVQQSSKSSSILGTKRVSSVSAHQTSQGLGVNFDGELVRIAAPKIALQYVNSNAALNEIYAPGGEVSFLLGRNSLNIFEQKSSKSPIWLKFSSRIFEQLKHCDSQFAGVVRVDAKQIDLEVVRGHTLSFIDRLENKANAKLEYHTVDDYCNIQEHKVSAPGQGLLALISVAAAIATQGMGAALLSNLGASAAITSGTIGTMASAGFSSLCAQGSVLLAVNKGDPFKTMEAMMGTKTFKSLATAMLTAGVMDKMLDALNLPIPSDKAQFAEIVKFNIAKAGVNAALNMSLHGQSLDEALVAAIIDSTINITVASAVLNKGSTKLEYAALNAAIKGVKGSIDGDGVLCGALEGLLSAVLPDLLADKKGSNLRPEAEDNKSKLQGSTQQRSTSDANASDPKYKPKVPPRPNSYKVTYGNPNTPNPKNKPALPPRPNSSHVGNYKQQAVEPIKNKAVSNWLKIAWRAFNGERSPEVLQWQTRNRTAAPAAAQVIDNVSNFGPQKFVASFVQGGGERVEAGIKFGAEEVARLTLGEQTHTMRAVKTVGRFVGEEAARLRLGEQTKTLKFVNFVGEYIGTDAARFRMGHDTKTAAAFGQAYNSLVNMSNEELGRHLGNGFADFVLFDGLVRTASTVAKLETITKLEATIVNTTKKSFEATTATAKKASEGIVNNTKKIFETKNSNPLFPPTGVEDSKYIKLNPEGRIYFEDNVGAGLANKPTILHQFDNHRILPPTHNPGQIISTKFGNISLTEQGVKDFMAHNFERFEIKLRSKVDLGEIPGFDKFNSVTREQLKAIVSNTLSSVKHVTEGHFAKIGTKHAVVDIYSHQTGYTVRMVTNARGGYTFETLMAGKTTEVHLTEFMTYAAKKNTLG